MNPSRICFFAILSKDFRKLRSSDVLAILLIAYGHILPKLFEFFKLNIEIAQNIFCLFLIILENMAVSCENLHLRTSAHHWHVSAGRAHTQCVHVFYHFKVLIFSY